MQRRAFTFAAATAFLAACSRDSDKTIGVIPKGAAHIFWQTVHAGSVKAGREAGYQIEWSSPKIETEAGRQIEIVESMINRRLAGIAIAPIDSKALVRVIDRASDAGIPVAVFDSDVETTKRITFVATNNIESGRIAARRMAQILNGKGKVAVVGFKPGSASTMEREQGFVDEMKSNHPDITVLPIQYSMADSARALAITENYLTANPDLAGLFADNESSSIGASQGLKSRNNHQVKFIAYDASDSLIADLRAGWIDSIVLQNPFKMGYEAVRAITESLAGRKPLPDMDSGVTLITTTDLDRPEIKDLIHPDLKTYL